MRAVIGIPSSLIIALLLTACGSNDEPRPIITSSCLSVSGKADLRCNRGVLNADVTQATIGRTICTANWTDKVRPPTTYTTPLKAQQMVAYGAVGSPGQYREDHLLPLSLGGSPTDPLNLWPQAVEVSRDKDLDAARLKQQVCLGALTLANAQDQILNRWTYCPATACVAVDPRSTAVPTR